MQKDLETEAVKSQALEDNAAPRPRNLLPPEDFTFHYDNLKYAYERHKTYLCYNLERLEGDTHVLLDSDVLQNQGFSHVEKCFLLSENVLEKLEAPGSYLITWYISWSPCDLCAKAVISFLRQHPNVTLHIFVARLFFHKTPQNRKALRALRRAKARIQIMSAGEFNHCWETFVDHRGRSFEAWEDLDANVDRLAEQLQGMLLAKRE